MTHRSKGVAKLQRVEAILENPEIYRLAELIPYPERHDMIDEALASQYGFDEEELDYLINHDIKYRLGARHDPDKVRAP